MYKRILFATDGSPNAENAKKYALELASKYDATVVIVHIASVINNILKEDEDNSSRDYIKKLEQDLTDEAKALLNDMQSEFERKEFKAEILLVEGRHAGKMIAQAADSEECEIIVIGSRGFGALKSILLGSTSNYVLHHTKKPVFIVP